VGQSGWGCVLAFNAGDSVDKVSNFYLTNLPGWNKQVDARTPESTTLIFKKGNLNLSLSASPETEGHSSVMLSVNQD
jgi:hypothetical protein